MTDPRDDETPAEAAPLDEAPADATAEPAPLSDEAWGIDRAAEPSRAKRKPRGGAPAYRAGFVSFVGRPNVGKSTLTNALVGEKVAITSSKPQTTRKAIRGIVHRPDGQLILVDTPGIHRPRTLLGERLNALVQTTLGDVDVIGLCIPADERIGPGDRFINEQLDEYPRARAVLLLRDWDAIVPVSAVEAIQLDALVGELLKALPVSEQLYPSDAVTEEGLEARISELIREAALEGVQDELPHSLAVTIDDMIQREDKELLEIYANLFVERDSQKGIVIGAQGSRLKHVGQVARAQIEPLVGTRVFLSLRVKIAKDWQRDPKLLGRLGF
jgi:GTP-binding protein Era